MDINTQVNKAADAIDTDLRNFSNGGNRACRVAVGTTRVIVSGIALPLDTLELVARNVAKPALEAIYSAGRTLKDVKGAAYGSWGTLCGVKRAISGQDYEIRRPACEAMDATGETVKDGLKTVYHVTETAAMVVASPIVATYHSGIHVLRAVGVLDEKDEKARKEKIKAEAVNETALVVQSLMRMKSAAIKRKAKITKETSLVAQSLMRMKSSAMYSPKKAIVDCFKPAKPAKPAKPGKAAVAKLFQMLSKKAPPVPKRPLLTPVEIMLLDAPPAPKGRLFGPAAAA